MGISIIEPIVADSAGTRQFRHGARNGERRSDPGDRADQSALPQQPRDPPAAAAATAAQLKGGDHPPPVLEGISRAC
jgi:hypothetical protein